jgi:predicted phage terminase large subunit-like protein
MPSAPLGSGFYGRAYPGLADELSELVGEPELVPPDADEAELEAHLAAARGFLGLPPGAEREEIQQAFARTGGFAAFREFFFPHLHANEAGEPVPGPRFQDELVAALDALIRSARAAEEVRACPREHGKSVVASLELPIYALANRIRMFGFWFSNTADQAFAIVEDVRAEVDGNERLRAVYPEFCTFEGSPSRRRLWFGNGATLMAGGKGKSVRGVRRGKFRPDLLGLDDIDKDSEVENKKLRERLMRWYHRVVKKLGRSAVTIVVGTILHAAGFLASLIGGRNHLVYRAIAVYPAELGGLWARWEAIYHDRSIGTRGRQHLRARRSLNRTSAIVRRRIAPRFRHTSREAAAFAFYQANRTAMDAGAELQWPERFTLYELMRERADDLPSFLSERQNEPFDPAANWFPEDKLVFVDGSDKPAADQVVFSVGMWDPSRGTTKSDTSAVPRLDVLRDGRRFVSWGLCERTPPEEVIETIIGKHKIHPFNVVGVEKVGLSSYDADLQRVAREQHQALPVQPVTPVGEKHGRIKSMRPLVVSGGLFFAADLPLEAVVQLRNYPQHPNDDFWDAVQQANTLADEYMHEVSPAGATAEPDQESGRIEVASVFGDEPPPRFASRGWMRERLGSVFGGWS